MAVGSDVAEVRTWKPRRGVALFCVLLLAGCGGIGKDETDVGVQVRSSDLAAMVVPRRELGPLAQGLRVDDDSGPTNNRDAAADTIDPRDSGRTLKRSGRVRGYDLAYTAANGLASRRRVVGVWTSAELFRDEDAASTYADKQLRDLERFRGRELDDVTVAGVERFDVDDVGAEAEGMRMVVVYPDATAFATLVGFRCGRVVGTAVVLLARERDIAAEVKGIARTLERRLERVAAGTVGRKRVSLPAGKRAPDPRLLTLDANALGLQAPLMHAGYVGIAGIRAYLREYKPGRLGKTDVWYARTMGQVFESARVGARDQRYLASRRGSRVITRRFLRGLFRKSGFIPGRVHVRPLGWRGPDTASFQFFFDVPKGRMEGVMMSVARGRLRGTLMVIGLANAIEPADVWRLRGRVRARLARTGAS